MKQPPETNHSAPQDSQPDKSQHHSRRRWGGSSRVAMSFLSLLRATNELNAGHEYRAQRYDREHVDFDDAQAHGRLANLDDLKENNLLGDHGITIGHVGDHAVKYPRFASGLIYGPPGIGKDVTLVDPILGTIFDRSLFVIDVAGESREKSFAHRSKTQSCNPHVIAPYRKGSARYNPLQPVIDLNEDSQELELAPYDAAKSLIPPSKSEHEGSWVRRGAINLTAELIRLDILTYGSDSNPGRIFDQLNGGSDTLGPKFIAMTQSSDPVLELAGARLLNRMQHNPKELGFIADEACDFLLIYQEGSPLRAASSASDVTPAELKDAPRTVYFEIPGDKMFVARQYVAAVMNSFIEGVAMAPGKTRTLFLANEFTQIGMIPSLRKSLRLYRKYGVQFLLYSQSRSAIEEIYGEQGRRDIEEICEFIQILGTDDPGLIRDISTWSGMRSVHLRESTLNSGATPSVSDRINQSTRPVLQSENIRSLGRNEQIIKFVNMPLIFAERRYWKDDPYLLSVLQEPSSLSNVI